MKKREFWVIETKNVFSDQIDIVFMNRLYDFSEWISKSYNSKKSAERALEKSAFSKDGWVRRIA